jgi:PAS domain S-box-containing protein
MPINHSSTLDSTTRAERQALQHILDTLPVAIRIVDARDHSPLYANQAALDLFGCQSYEQLSEQNMPAHMPQAQPSGKAVVEEAQCFKSNGEPFYARISSRTVDFKSRRAVLSTLEDIKIERNFQNMVRELEEANAENEFQLVKLNLAMKAANIGLWDMEINQDDPVNPVNTIIWSNKFRNILGYENEEDFPNLISSFHNCLHPDDLLWVPQAITEHMLDKTGKTSYDVEYRAIKKNGELAYIRATGETIRDKNGNPLRVTGTIIDITEMRNIIIEAEKQRLEAETANKAKSVFLSHISHEIRTPINAVIGTAEIQLQKVILSPDIEEAFNTIYNSGNLLLAIINDMLDHSKIEAGKLELVPVQYDVPSLIYDAIQLNHLWYENKNISFNLKIDENTPHYLLGDELRIKQILNNILSNAFKYTDSGEVQLLVSAETDGRAGCTLMLAVKDTGQGMSGDQLERLFDDYSRFNMETNRSTVGTGLGMNIAKRLIDMMGGQITVISAPGQGSEFVVRLPQERVGSAVCGSELAKKLMGNDYKDTLSNKKSQIIYEYMPYGRVLIVDDVESNLYVAKGMMLPYGLTIETAASGFEALDKTRDEVYDIVFMDHMMPRMNGVEATLKMREAGYTGPIVALTANAVVGTSEMYLENGFDGFIFKPIDIRELNVWLTQLIRDKQPPEVLAAARLSYEQLKATQPQPVSPMRADAEWRAAFAKDAANVIHIFNSTLQSIDRLQGEDMDLFATTAHGIKSVLANMGEYALSNQALHLETTAKQSGAKLNASELIAFVDALNLLIQRDKQAQADQNTQASPEDTAFLRQSLRDICEACDAFDMAAISTLLVQLNAKAWPLAISEALSEMSVQLLRGEIEGIVATANKMGVQ